VEKIGGGIVKADAHTSVISANVVKHCVWLLQRLQVADISTSLASNLLSGCSTHCACADIAAINRQLIVVISVTFLQSSTGLCHLMLKPRCDLKVFDSVFFCF
jgi:hypothetical protein